MTKDRIDEMLAQHYARRDATDRAALRVLERLRTLPAQKSPRWHLPGLLLDWQFAPAWPRMAVLAGCAVIGFAIGTMGIDRFVQPQAQDLAAVFEPEPLTGLRP